LEEVFNRIFNLGLICYQEINWWTTSGKIILQKYTEDLYILERDKREK